MPLPTPEEFRDRTKKHSQVRELLAQLSENVLGLDAANANPIFKPNNYGLPEQDLNNFTKAGITVFNNSVTNPDVSKNFPFYGTGSAGTLFVMAVKVGETSTNNIVRQVYITASDTYFRTTTSGVFGTWKKLINEQNLSSIIDSNPLYKPNNYGLPEQDLNDFTKAGITVFNNSLTNAEVSKNFPKYGTGSAGTLFVMAVKVGETSTNNIVRQMYITTTEVYFRTTTSGLFGAWKKLLTSDDLGSVTIFNASSAAIDFHTLTTTAQYAFTSTGHLDTCTNKPPESALGFLTVERISSAAIILTMKYNNGREYVKRLFSGTWRDWVRTDSGKDLNTATSSEIDATIVNSYLYRDGNTLKRAPETLPAWYNITNTDLVTSHQSIYDMYDLLMTDFPDFVTREQVGTSVQGRAIYCYTVNPPPKRLESIYENKKPQKIVIQSFIHGIEHSGALGVFGFFENLLRYHREIDGYSRLRTGFQYKVIPVANPDGVTLGTRENANGVDLNRDWEDFTQPETQQLRDFYRTQSDALMFIDSHSHDSLTNLWWLASNTNYDLIEYIGDELLAYGLRHLSPTRNENNQFLWLAPSLNTKTCLSFLTRENLPAMLIENINSATHPLANGGRIGMRKIAVYSIYQLMTCILNIHRAKASVS
ncbi:M14 family zinc carboxypeptidase [Acinetobacter sp. YH01009]|uniref:M14 family zinc carboxypeptidase n=1 Tax=Acinetobacter sp. YH01009 TaxID=2601025 RepID=UPI0015D27816|nr:M14 family zinc carboxypeptidase [Acinetobacter sp. YH01009]